MSRKTMAFVMAAFLLLSSFVFLIPSVSKAAPMEKTYTFSDLKSTMEYGLTSKVSDDGTLEISFEDQYKSQFYAIPSDVDPSTITKVTFEVTSKNESDLAFKLHTKADYESDNKEGTPVSYGKAEIIPNAKDVKYFSIMSLNSGTTKATIKSVTFYVSGEGNPQADGEEEETVIEGENLIKNGNFDDPDVSMWGTEQGSAKITIAEADEPIFGDVKTYGIINDRTRPYDCFSYDVTDIVKNGSTYAYSFYIKLSDDYEGAPGTQRQVDFAPYITSGGSTNYLGSYSPDITGSSSQQLTPGEWTKFEGTYKVSAMGDIDQLVLRFLEQGEDYGEGDCVMGEYYITGVTFVDLNLAKATIEATIPNLKDKMTEDFGDDMICGTSLSGSEINDEVLMQLVEKHFNSITLGNELKPDAHLGNTLRGTEEVTINGEKITVPVLDYSQAERYLDYILEWNEEHPDQAFKIRGHVLVWHSQTPDWFFREDYNVTKPYVEPEEMNLRQEWYIKSILEHYVGEDSKYKDLFYGWDVVNEAVSDASGTYRTDAEGSSWWAVYRSNEFIINAFKYANKYAPADLELYYNDYNDCTPGKVEGIVALLNDVKNAEGTRIDAMGMQGHYDIDYPTMDQFESAAKKYGEVVGKIMVTELDFKSSSAYDGTAATLQGEYSRQAYRYKALYDTMKKLNDEGSVKVGGFIVWGVIDGNSWLQAFTGVGGGVTDGSPQCPLLFDDDYKAKPAFWAIVDPTKLAPETKSISVSQAMVDDFSLAQSEKFTAEDTTVEFKTIWNDGQLQFDILVYDMTASENDSVTVYLDRYNSKTDGIKTRSVEVKRTEEMGVDSGGYKVTINVPMEEAAAGKIAGFDIVVVNDDKTIAYNDTTMSQATSSKYFAEAALKPFMFIPKGTVTIDGELDEAWNKATEITLGNVNGNAKASATVKLLWDEEYLYAYATVTDDDLNKDSEQVHEQDSFEIFIDETNSKATEYNNGTKQYRINYENAHSFNGETCTEENCNTFAKTTDTGYVVEGAFKWTEVKPEVSSYIGIELQINDADSTAVRLGTVTWNDTTDQCWSNPSCYGTAMLVEDAVVTNTSEDGKTGNKKSKTGLIVGIGAAAVLACAAGVLSLKKGTDEDKENETEDFDKESKKSEKEETEGSEEETKEPDENVEDTEGTEEEAEESTEESEESESEEEEESTEEESEEKDDSK